jgi:hypothetical protein
LFGFIESMKLLARLSLGKYFRVARTSRMLVCTSRANNLFGLGSAGCQPAAFGC